MQQYSRASSGITRNLYWTDHLMPVMLVKNSSTWDRYTSKEMDKPGVTKDHFISLKQGTKG